jgi:hypothetical protein
LALDKLRNVKVNRRKASNIPDYLRDLDTARIIFSRKWSVTQNLLTPPMAARLQQQDDDGGFVTDSDVDNEEDEEEEEEDGGGVEETKGGA